MSEPTFSPKQTYKNRAEAYRLFIKVQNLPVGMTKFYDDCVALKLVNPDKSIDLAPLLAYMKDHLKIAPSTGQSLTDRSRENEIADLEFRKAKAEADIKEVQAQEAKRKLDEKWLHQEEAWAAIAGLIGTLRDNLRHQFHIGSAELIQLAGGDPLRSPEVYEKSEEIMNRAFNQVVDAGRIEGLFAEELQEEDF